MSGTTISTFEGDQFAARLADLFPRGWCSDDAKQPGGNVYALLLSAGDELMFVQQELQYALAAQRIPTETFPELDLASVDFYGGALPRQPGTTDAAFANQIMAGLFAEAATRPALQDALTRLTGFIPRMLEPWSVSDTGVWGRASYWNVDTVQNPARWGNGGLRYQGFIETAPPQLSAIGVNNPVLCWGDGSYWNVPGYFFGIIAPVNINAVNDLINKLRAYGTIVWVKLVSSGTLATSVAPGLVGNLTAASSGASTVALTWTAPVTGTPPFTFSVSYRQTGTISYFAGPTVQTPSASVSGLTPNVTYDFTVLTRNVAGNSGSTPPVTATTNKVPPAPVTNLIATQVQATSVTVTWSAPSTGTPPFTYTALYRVSGTTQWSSLLVGQDVIGVSIINLQPATSYDIEISTSNI